MYIAGPYSATSILAGLENIRRGQRAATEYLLAGYAVFCPWLDHQLFLQLREGEQIDLATIREHSMAWLSVSDMVVVLEGWEQSEGTKAEIKRAEELGIPVTYETH